MYPLDKGSPQIIPPYLDMGVRELGLMGLVWELGGELAQDGVLPVANGERCELGGRGDDFQEPLELRLRGQAHAEELWNKAEALGRDLSQLEGELFEISERIPIVNHRMKGGFEKATQSDKINLIRHRNKRLDIARPKLNFTGAHL